MFWRGLSHIAGPSLSPNVSTLWISPLYQQAFSQRAIIPRLAIRSHKWQATSSSSCVHCPAQTIIALSLRPGLKYALNVLSERRNWMCDRPLLGFLNCWALVYIYLSLSSTPHSPQCWTTSRWPWKQLSLGAANNPAVLVAQTTPKSHTMTQRSPTVSEKTGRWRCL